MQNKSILYALVAVLSWSTVATAFKIALRYLTHFELVGVACATSAIIFALVLTFQHKWGDVRRLRQKDWLYFALLGLLNPVAYYLVLFKAYDMLPAHVAQPINYTWPILLVLMLAVFGGQRIPRQKYLGMAVSLAGVSLIALGKGDDGIPTSGSGILLGFLSAFLWASYWIINNRFRDRHDSMVALFVSFLFGTLYCRLGALFVESSSYTLEGLLAGCYVGAFEMGIPFIFFALALRTTNNPALVNQLTYLSPFLSLLLISVILGETITMMTISGLVLIVLGIVWNEFCVKKQR